MANFVTLHAMRLGDAPRDWESCLRLVAPRYRERATGPAPERSRCCPERLPRWSRYDGRWVRRAEPEMYEKPVPHAIRAHRAPPPGW